MALCRIMIYRKKPFKAYNLHYSQISLHNEINNPANNNHVRLKSDDI